MRRAGASGSNAAASVFMERDRYLDALRVFAILMVVSGHWLVRVIVETADGPSGVYLLNLSTELQWATLLWQVMPIFFFVGGVVNLQSWQRARAAGESASGWVRRRAHGLLTPVLVFLAVLLPVALLTRLLGADEPMVFDFGVAVFPMWFLAVYLVVTSLTPLTVRLHEQGGGRLLLLGAGALAVVLDLFRFTVGGPVLGTQPLISSPNFLLVWIVVHQLGYSWADGRFDGRGAALIWGASGILAGMILLGPWPLSMVPFEGTTRPNNGAPPSAALIAMGVIQLGAAVALRNRVAGWIARPGVWAAIGLVGAHSVTIYLWHQPVMVAVANLAGAVGWVSPAPLFDAYWWAGRFAWVCGCLAVLIPVAGLAARASRALQPVPRDAGAAVTVFGIALTCSGIAGIIAVGGSHPGLHPGLALAPPAVLLAGASLLGVFARRAERTG